MIGTSDAVDHLEATRLAGHLAAAYPEAGSLEPLPFPLSLAPTLLGAEPGGVSGTFGKPRDVSVDPPDLLDLLVRVEGYGDPPHTRRRADEIVALCERAAGHVTRETTPVVRAMIRIRLAPVLLDPAYADVWSIERAIGELSRALEELGPGGNPELLPRSGLRLAALRAAARQPRAGGRALPAGCRLVRGSGRPRFVGGQPVQSGSGTAPLVRR